MTTIINEDVINEKNLENQFNKLLDVLRLHKSFAWSQKTGESNLYTNTTTGESVVGTPYFTYEVKEPFDFEGCYKLFPNETNRYTKDKTKITLSNGDEDSTSYESGVVTKLPEGTLLGVKIEAVRENSTSPYADVIFEITNTNFDAYLSLLSTLEMPYMLFNRRFNHNQYIDRLPTRVSVDWESLKLKPREIGKIREQIKKVSNLPKTLIAQIEIYTSVVERVEKELNDSKTYLSTLKGFAEPFEITSVKEVA